MSFSDRFSQLSSRALTTAKRVKTWQWVVGAAGAYLLVDYMRLKSQSKAARAYHEVMMMLGMGAAPVAPAVHPAAVHQAVASAMAAHAQAQAAPMPMGFAPPPMAPMPMPMPMPMYAPPPYGYAPAAHHGFAHPAAYKHWWR